MAFESDYKWCKCSTKYQSVVRNQLEKNQKMNKKWKKKDRCFANLRTRTRLTVYRTLYIRITFLEDLCSLLFIKHARKNASKMMIKKKQGALKSFAAQLKGSQEASKFLWDSVRSLPNSSQQCFYRFLNTCFNNFSEICLRLRLSNYSLSTAHYLLPC